MQPIGRAVRFGTAIGALLLGGAQLLAGQGITSAAVAGRVTSEGRGTVENGIVALINTTTGARQQATTNSAGRYNFENVPPGGPYTVEVRAIGFQQASKTGIMLALGQRYVQDFELKQQVVTLQELTVIAATNPLINSGRTGPAQIVTDTAIQRYPLLGRNFTDLLRTSPQVISGSSVAGQNNRFNTILIDGGVNNDIFGLSSSGTPGGTAGAKPISVEALQEFQILVAPFDIRQGSFTGGMVNGITKSGTNQFHGSAFGYIQRPELVGKDTAGIKIGTFSIKQYGGSVSGPIIRNKLLFFGSADLQTSVTPFFGPEATEPATGISVATAQRVENILKSKYGFDPGGVTAPQTLGKPDKNLFGKLNWNIGDRSGLELSYNYTKATQDNFIRNLTSDGTRDGWELSNSGYTIANKTNSLRSKFTTLVGGGNLELLAGYQTVRDARAPGLVAPEIMVQGDIAGHYVAAGGERFSHGNSLDQNIYEATGNYTFQVGGHHQVTLGTHNEFFSFVNLFANNKNGTWTFGSVDSLDAGLPRRFEVLLPLREGGFIADFQVKQFGGYVQDAWRPNERVTFTAGLRYDVPTSDKPFQNPNKALTDTLGINTGQFPSGNGLWSPRLGFNWDPAGNGNTIMRGGVGLFSGRPPYVWMSNAFTNTGLESVNLICGRPDNGSTPPPFTVDLTQIPNACAASGTPSPPVANVNYFDKGFKFQQALKYAFGVDQRIPGGMVATVDFLRTQSRNQLYQTDDNVLLGAVNGEGRQLYATVNAAGTALTRLKKTAGIGTVVHHLNKSADESTLFTAQLQKSFANGITFSGSYTYSKTKDLMSMTSSIATSNLRFTSLDGTLDNRNLRTSAFDVPHKVAISGSANLPYGIQTSVIFTARAGVPYAWTYISDVNGDGQAGNDLLYVPRDINDISLNVPSGGTAQAEWDRLNAFIVSEPCLRDQRGRIMERNSCRNPWQKFVDVRLAKVVPTLTGQSFQVTADVFNFLNLLNKDWGLARETSTFEEANVLTLASYDNRGTATQADDRGKYTVPSVLPALKRVNVSSSRWRIQLGGKYIF
jgi:outer membrane receptor protein involved in Fe transport